MFRKISTILTVLAFIAVVLQQAPTAVHADRWDGWTHELVVADLTVCGVALHLEGDAYIYQQPDNYHVRYFMAGTGSDGNNYHANPRVDVITRDRQDKTLFVSRDIFKIFDQDGRFSTHIANYRFIFRNGVLTHSRIRLVDDCK